MAEHCILYITSVRPRDGLRDQPWSVWLPSSHGPEDVQMNRGRAGTPTRALQVGSSPNPPVRLRTVTSPLYAVQNQHEHGQA
jgi:hypothetical protein